ncbi:hypothetical protein [Ruminococcus sp.]|uniref:hypothetical protein n=1 Tax=Ruminococcus sp. TaxID=41978 RepID=UPI0025CDC9F6|nr:hypothetical protein [Ruminococcus sp.]
MAAFEYADEIWIQVNGLHHQQSMPVINLAKTRNIPVKYFSKSGAQQCAKQLANHDRSFRKAV